MRLVVFSTKRSSHHAFLEAVCTPQGNFFYENNVRISRTGALRRSVERGETKWKSRAHLASFEMNYSLPEVLHEPAFEDFNEFQKLVFLRDPMNTVASTLSVYRRAPNRRDERWVWNNIEQWFNLWGFLRSSSFLKQPIAFVYANHFFADSDYRAQVAELIGATIALPAGVSRFGGGGNSWFEGKSVEPAALNGRYRHFITDPIFRKIVNSHAQVFTDFYAALQESKMMRDLEALIG